ncbi:MAG: hypothetical protein ACD_73C00474G0001 [uncultured bacterium]|nr:MAG: hypothetical protein ACD_73C00474G0001 [uncultured bacterium]
MLVEKIQTQLECIYGIGLKERAYDFLINLGDVHNYVNMNSETKLPKELLLVRKPEDDTVEVALYLADDLINNLDQHDPFESITPKNLNDFCTMIEGVSHFVYYLWKAQQNLPITQLELELQAEVDKFLMLYFYLRSDQNPQVGDTIFDSLFEDFKLFDELSIEARERYLTASQLASRYCYRLKTRFQQQPHDIENVVSEIRQFYTFAQEEKIRRIIV